MKTRVKIFQGLKDLDITLDGAAFQKAIDIASKNKGEVIAEKNYAINFPLITRSDVIIDGNKKGFIYNDRSRSKNIHHLAFFFGNYSASAFYKSDNNSSGYILYDVKGDFSRAELCTIGTTHLMFLRLKSGQLVMVASAFKRTG